MKIFYHGADLDGKCSAAIARFHEGRGQLIPIDYDQRPDLSAISMGEKVYILDFSFPLETMIEIHKRAQLVWIDHHKTAIEEAEAADFWPAGARATHLAACQLTWDYLFASPRPPVVNLLGMYDIWNLDKEDIVLRFQYGMRAIDPDPADDALWVPLLKGGPVDHIIANGLPILTFIRQYYASYARTHGFHTEFDGYPAYAVNIGLSNSLLVDACPEADIYIFYCYRPPNWHVSLRSKTVDVGTIARSHGGGGHERAAGFISPSLPHPLRMTLS